MASRWTWLWNAFVIAWEMIHSVSLFLSLSLCLDCLHVEPIELELASLLFWILGMNSMWKASISIDCIEGSSRKHFRNSNLGALIWGWTEPSWITSQLRKKELAARSCENKQIEYGTFHGQLMWTATSEEGPPVGPCVRDACRGRSNASSFPCEGSGWNP